MAHFRFARWGRTEVLLGTLLAALVATLLGWLVHPAVAAAPLPLLAFWLWFFRDPDRATPAGADLLLAPADGRVADVAEVIVGAGHDPPVLGREELDFLGGRAVRIGIFLSPLDVHVNRAPCAGRVALLARRPGGCRAAYSPDAATGNEARTLGLELLAPDAPRVLVRQITGVLARRIVCALSMGQTLAAGERFGMIKFGSRTELWVPAGRMRVEVAVGQRVRGGETILGRIQPPGHHEEHQAHQGENPD